jgi:uncharacterized cofD-like protein
VRVTGLGGGHGLAATLRAARLYADDVSAVVTVADDGGSSGRLTRELGVPPPGDIRNCLVALADDSRLADLYQHRFRTGALEGHPVGNLLIAALAEMSGDFAAAVDEAGRLLQARGAVYPATTELVTLRARVRGAIVEGQAKVAKTEAPIEAVTLEPADPSAHPGAAEAIRRADQVVLGPGSLFTSIIATLCVPGISKALAETSATRVFVCNARMQPGETQGMNASAHLRALLSHLDGGALDVAVFQSPVRPDDGVEIDAELTDANVRVVEADVVDGEGVHDPDKLAAVLRALAG